LAPSIIFVDELDTFLNPRDGAENSAGNAIKAEFLTLWDGISTNMAVSPVLVLGATNRPNQVDSAILRRLPRMFRIELPTAQGRLDILRLTLKGHPLDDSALQYLPQLATNLKGYSGSDLKELCQCAALESVREVMKEHSYQAVMSSSKQSTDQSPSTSNTAKPPPPSSTTPSTTTASTSPATQPLRPMSKRDLVVAQTKVKRTGHDAAEYERQQFRAQHGGAGPDINPSLLQQLAAVSQMLQGLQGGQPVVDDGEEDESDEDDNVIPQLF
jgi:SpoVK/Ycf46/Vps4 family AAA+-type ATPase